MLVVFSVLLENSGLLKAGPRQAEFEPAAGKTYKFSDVHGVDEAKDVRTLPFAWLAYTYAISLLGAPRGCHVFEGSD